VSPGNSELCDLSNVFFSHASLNGATTRYGTRPYRQSHTGGDRHVVTFLRRDTARTTSRPRLCITYLTLVLYSSHWNKPSVSIMTHMDESHRQSYGSLKDSSRSLPLLFGALSGLMPSSTVSPELTKDSIRLRDGTAATVFLSLPPVNLPQSPLRKYQRPGYSPLSSPTSLSSAS